MHIGKKGFTLVEIIVSLAIMSIVAGAVGAFVIAGNNSYMRGNKELTLQEEAQLTANQLIDLIIDVERGISFRTTTGQAVDEAGNPVADNVPVSELLLRNNDNVYMVRWQGQTAGAEYAAANQLYLYEASNTKDADGKITAWGDPSDPSQATPSLMAEYVTAFNIDLTDLEKRKVKLEMTFVYQDKSYNVSETIKLRNDLSDEESDGYVWIDGLSIAPDPAYVARGASQTFTYKFSGDSAAVKAAAAQGVSWSVSKADGSACSSSTTIDSDGKLSVALDEQLGDGVLTVTCTSKADTSKVATAVVNVKTNVHYSISISPKAENIMQGQQKTFTCTVTKTENGKTEEVTGMAVDWDVSAIGVTKDADTKIVNGLLTVGRNQKEGTGVLQVTCMLSNDKSIKDTAMVNVLPYSKIDGKYDAKLIAETLTLYDLDTLGEPNVNSKRVGYTGQIECLPSWADYAHGFPKIVWSIPEDPTQSKYTITGNEGPNESQYTATLRCGTQYNVNNPGVRVVANVKLSEDVMVVLDIVIVVPDLKTAVIEEAPYIYSSQFVLNRNDKITCSIKNYNQDGGKVLWKIADMQSDLYSTCTHNGVSYRNPMVGLTPLKHMGVGDIWPSYELGDNDIDGCKDHGTFDFTTERIGTTTDVWAKWYVDMDKEYHLNLQAWSLDGTTLVAETTILIPKFDILFYKGEHVKEIVIPTDNDFQIQVEFYGFTNYSVVMDKYKDQAEGIGPHKLELDAKITGEYISTEDHTIKPGGYSDLISLRKNGLYDSPPSVEVNIGDNSSWAQWGGQVQKNEYLLLSFWDVNHPELKRNLMLVLKKNNS